MIERSVNSLPGYCSGCGACIATCDYSAVRIDLNEDGFFYANVDQTVCTQCGKCRTVCMRDNSASGKDLIHGEMFAAQSMDSNTITQCTSGGIAYEMTKYALDEKILVAGVIYDDKNEIARTIVSDSCDSADLFRGSKYLQSKTDEAFLELLKKAKNDPDKRFLVIGTPCQIYGLAQLLEGRGIRDRFILVDLFCHGVPSYLVWTAYLEYIKKIIEEREIREVFFRDKSIGWHNFVMHINGKMNTYEKSSEGDLFYKAFFDNVLLNKSCFQCNLRKNFSQADIRLGDYWGKKYQNREDGVSAVLLLSQNGEKFFHNLANVLVIEKTSVEDVLKYQSVHDYNTSSLFQDAIVDLRATRNLEGTIRKYRKNFSIQRRAKLLLKETTTIMPNCLRSLLRKIYRSCIG